MKKILVLLILFFTIFNLSACSSKQTYELKASFNNKLVEQAEIIPKSDSLDIEIPLAGISCNVDSFKTLLERKQDTFIVTLVGDETEERCSRNFTATISPISIGEYWLKVIYEKNGENTELLSERFVIK
jgi:hypothetical protein